MIDALLGSTAIAGSVDTVLVESRQRDNLRSITTNQRVGDEIDPPGLVLLLDKDAGTLSLGASLADTRMDTLIARIITCLVTHPWQSERTLRDEVPGCDSNLSKALREAMRRGQVCQDGGGKKGDPHVYAAASETRAYKAKEQQREEKAERAKEAKEANQPDVQFSDSRLSGSLASNLWEPTE